MQYTLSLHNGGFNCVRQAHNARRYMPPNADPDRSGDNITFCDVPVRDAYHKLFDDAVKEFNERQIACRKKDRVIKDYYTQILDSRKQAAYELIVQIGGKADGGTPDAAVQALKEFYSGWQKANPQLVICGGYLHLDEQSPHLHIDYIPLAQCTRGMKLQNSLTRALKEQGFVTKGRSDTAQMQWEQSERDRFRGICSNLGIDVAAQGVGRRRHLSVDEYKDACDQVSSAIQTADMLNDDVRFWTERLSEVQSSVRNKRSAVKQLDSEIQERRAAIADLKSGLGRRQNEAAALDNRIRELHDGIDALKASYEKQRSEGITLFHEVRKERDSLDRLKEKISGCTAELSFVKAHIQEKDTLLSDKRKQLASVKREIEEASADLSSIRDDLDRARADWDNEVGPLLEELEWLRAYRNEVYQRDPDADADICDAVNSQTDGQQQLYEDEMEL